MSNPYSQYLNNNVGTIRSNLLKAASELKNPGLFHGKMGMAIVNYLMFRVTKESDFEELADSLIDEVYTFLNKQRIPIDFENGLAGIGWGIEFLVQNGFIEADTDLVLEDIDARIFSEIAHPGSKSFSSGINDGLPGLVIYCIWRLQGESSNFEMRFIMERLLGDLINKIAVQTENGNFAINDASGFNLFWNIPVNLYVLSEASQLNLHSGKINKILANIEPKLCSLLPISHINRALLLIGMQSVVSCYSSEMLRNHINHLQKNIDAGHIWINEMKSMNFSLGTGVAGAWWVLDRLNNHFPVKSSISSLINCNSQIESISFFETVFNPSEAVNRNPGLLHGYSGMLMALLFSGIIEKQEVKCF